MPLSSYGDNLNALIKAAAYVLVPLALAGAVALLQWAWVATKG